MAIGDILLRYDTYVGPPQVTHQDLAPELRQGLPLPRSELIEHLNFETRDEAGSSEPIETWDQSTLARLEDDPYYDPHFELQQYMQEITQEREDTTSESEDPSELPIATALLDDAPMSTGHIPSAEPEPSDDKPVALEPWISTRVEYDIDDADVLGNDSYVKGGKKTAYAANADEADYNIALSGSDVEDVRSSDAEHDAIHLEHLANQELQQAQHAAQAMAPPEPMAEPVPFAQHGSFQEVFNFGVKHLGQTYEHVTETDPSYFFWATGRLNPNPAPCLQVYIDWVHAHYIVDLAAQKLIKTTTLGTFSACPSAMPSAPPPKSTPEERRLRWAKTEKCQPCVGPYSWKGSNSYQRKSQCLICGTITVIKHPRPGCSPESAAAAAACPHVNVNHSGSTRTTSRVYCRDCNTYISEEPASAETRAAAKKPPPPPRPGSGYTHAPERPNIHVPRKDCRDVTKAFSALVKSHLNKTDEDFISQLQLEAMLSDAIDLVQQDKKTSSDDDDGDVPKSTGHSKKGTGLMHQVTPVSLDVESDEDDGSAIIPAHLAEPALEAAGGRRVMNHPDLETVDPTTDSRVFAFLDEGCNASCHGTIWARHAIAAFEAAGSHKPVSELNTSKRRDFQGIGAKRSLGQRTIPWGLLYQRHALDGSVSAQGTI